MGKIVNLRDFTDDTVTYPVTVSEGVLCEHDGTYVSVTEKINAIKSAITYLYPLVVAYNERHKHSPYDFTNFTTKYSSEVAMYSAADARYTGLTSSNTMYYEGAVDDTNLAFSQGLVNLEETYPSVKNNKYAIISRLLDYAGGNSSAKTGSNSTVDKTVSEVAFFEFSDLTPAYDEANLTEAWMQQNCILFNIATHTVQGSTFASTDYHRCCRVQLNDTTGKPEFGVCLASVGATNATYNAYWTHFESKASNGYYKLAVYRSNGKLGWTINGVDFTEIDLTNYKNNIIRQNNSKVSIMVHTYPKIANTEYLSIHPYKYIGSNIQNFIKNTHFFG